MEEDVERAMEDEVERAFMRGRIPRQPVERAFADLQAKHRDVPEAWQRLQCNCDELEEENKELKNKNADLQKTIADQEMASEEKLEGREHLLRTLGQHMTDLGGRDCEGVGHREGL